MQWLGDPAVLTAIASLIIAIAAFRRIRFGVLQISAITEVHEVAIRAELPHQLDRLPTPGLLDHQPD